jgi:tRNA(Leu) C34 or U34 (ribose-2'-O)-methylase TrmL
MIGISEPGPINFCWDQKCLNKYKGEPMNTEQEKMKNRGFSCVGLDNPKTKENIGSAIRACGVYGASMIAVSGMRYKKACTDTMKHAKHLPLLQVEDLKTVIPFDCVPIAVDLIEGATQLHEYQHPERAFYIFGAEDATLGKRTTDYCRDIIYIPTSGCMNLAATVNVVLYDRMAKQLNKVEYGNL